MSEFFSEKQLQEIMQCFCTQKPLIVEAGSWAVGDGTTDIFKFDI